MSTADRDQSSQPVRRRRYIINAAFQWKYAIVIFTFVFCSSMMMSSVLFGVLSSKARTRILFSSDPGAINLWESASVVFASGFAFAGLTALAVGAWSILMTHRICGPLFVMERLLRELAAGEVPQWRALRKRDELKGLNETLRTVVESVKTRREAELANLTKAVELARSGAAADDQACRDALQQVQSVVQTLREDVARQLAAVEPARHTAPGAASADQGAPVAVTS